MNNLPQDHILLTYEAGTILNNLGCSQGSDHLWCDVQELGGGPRGFVAAEYLKPAISPHGSAAMGPDDSAMRVGHKDFDATGQIPCSQADGQPTSQCEFGVSRSGGGDGTVVVSRPDGTSRTIFFQMGKPTGFSSSEAQGYPDFSATKESDLHIILIGDERYEIPDAVILGG